MDTTKTIYIVDDDEDDMLVIREAIADLNLTANVYFAYNGSQLLEMLSKEVENGLILVDMNMPGMNGIEILQTVYANPDFKHLRSILTSTSSSTELKQRALESGAMQFICKPSKYDGYIKLMNDIFYKCF
ncbi:response regulator [Dyadobacter bucti]|uniref:response regulator n=1 Tax=Dyadobacter bucti TaxID=2572203 RepID=UPI001109E71B|nr:response regulator [Dyadobacter bucti]